MKNLSQWLMAGGAFAVAFGCQCQPKQDQHARDPHKDTYRREMPAERHDDDSDGCNPCGTEAEKPKALRMSEPKAVSKRNAEPASRPTAEKDVKPSLAQKEQKAELPKVKEERSTAQNQKKAGPQEKSLSLAESREKSKAAESKAPSK